MKETTENIVAFAEIAEADKPYKFRKLAAPDVFLMFKIIKAIGINEFVACLQGDSLKEMAKTFAKKTIEAQSDEGEKGVEDEQAIKDEQKNNFMMAALAGTLEIANVVIGNLPKCENDIYQLLAQTSNLSVSEIKAEGNAVMFFEMVIDFLKKEEFPDFIKVVSKLFK